MVQVFSTREQVVTRSVARHRSHGSHSIRLHKLSAKTEIPKSMDLQPEFSSLEIQPDFVHQLNHETRVPQISVEWTIMETSMEDGLMGRAAVSKGWSEKRTEGTLDESIKSEVSADLSSSRDEVLRQKFPDKMVKEPNCGNHHSLSRQCISSRIENAFSSDETELSSSVDDYSKSEKLRASFERLDEKPVTVSNERFVVEDSVPCKSTDSIIGVKLEAVKLRRRSDCFPPPLASLARKSHAHFPTQLTPMQLQPIRGNGRILLQEVKAPPQPDLFQPIRTQGRLVLQLIHYDVENPEATMEVKEGIPVEEFTANTKTDVASSVSN